MAAWRRSRPSPSAVRAATSDLSAPMEPGSKPGVLKGLKFGDPVMRKTLILFAAASVAGLAFSAHAQSNGDARGFIEDAIRADNAEMMLGKLAASHATDPKVRDYGRMLYDDHAHAKDKAAAV